MRKLQLVGVLSALGWCIFSSISRVFTGIITQTIEPVTLCFYMFLISAIFFSIINLQSTFTVFKLIITQRDTCNKFVLINITTFGAWFLLLYPLKYIGPSTVSSITLGIGPLSTLIAEKLFFNRAKFFSRFDTIIALLLILVIIYIVILITYKHELIRTNTAVSTSLYAIISCLIAGFSIAAQNICTKKISENGFSPQQILALRFWLLIIISGTIMKLCGIQSITFANLCNIIILSFCMVIIPLYLVQVSIKYISPLMFSMIAILMPICTFLFEFLDNKLHPSIENAIAILANCIILSFSFLLRYKNRGRTIGATGES
jgi:drug/metabolite transporter (DMT)-like permease